MSKNSILDTIDSVLKSAADEGFIHLNIEDSLLTETYIHIKGKKLVNFGSCSYLGLEFTDELKDAAKKAIDSFGTQFSSSRTYVGITYYKEFEEKLTKIFGSPTISVPTTTLGHISTIPVLVSPHDAVILDHQVHQSIQTAVEIVKARNTHVEIIRHNKMDVLEERIIKLSDKYEKIWYMADGVYSMFGDVTPLDKIYEFLNKYPKFHFYVDDAHAMSCYGKHGRGYVLSRGEIHEKMVVATSFSKAFASGGAAIIFPNEELPRKVKNCGGPLITSGPMQPAALGAAMASADIHLSDKIYELQDELHKKIKFTHDLLEKYKLPNLAESFSCIFFVGVSLPKVAYNIIKKVMNDGYFVNLSIFPAVPIKNTGIRFTITRLHTYEQIEGLVASIAKHFPVALVEEDFSLDKIYQAFKLKKPEPKEINTNYSTELTEFKINHYPSINEINAEKWNQTIGKNGLFDTHILQLLENSFKENNKKEDNWEFDYIWIEDNEKKPILATFLTTALAKDDMLSSKIISKNIEKERIKDPYFLTSNTLSVGSILTDGAHLFIDKTNPNWKKALHSLFEIIEKIQFKNNISTTVIRDFNINDAEMDDLMIQNGFIKYEMSLNNKIKNVNWEKLDDIQNQLSKRNKRHFKENIINHNHKFEVILEKSINEDLLNDIYTLYSNVKENNTEINTFLIPQKLFKNIDLNTNWELITLYLKPEFDTREKRKPVGMVLTYKGELNYTGVLVGLDYTYNFEHNVYRQVIYQVLKRAFELNYKNINLGFSAEIEKKKFGAIGEKSCAYLQVKDNYTLEVLNTFNYEN